MGKVAFLYPFNARKICEIDWDCGGRTLQDEDAELTGNDGMIGG